MGRKNKPKKQAEPVPAKSTIRPAVFPFKRDPFPEWLKRLMDSKDALLCTSVSFVDRHYSQTQKNDYIAILPKISNTGLTQIAEYGDILVYYSDTGKVDVYTEETYQWQITH